MLFARKKILLSALFVILSQHPQSAWSDHVRFCFNDWLPYSQMEAGRAVGVSIDILREAARRADLDVQFVHLPWNRCLKAVVDGKLDAVVDARPRAEFLQGVASTGVHTNTFWVREEEHLRQFQLPFLSGYSLGLVHGYDYPEQLTAEFQNLDIKIEYAVDDPTNIQKLASGRVDVIIADLVTTTFTVQQQKLKIRPLIPSYSTDRMYPSFNKDRAKLHSLIDSALMKMLDDGTIDSIYEKHLGISFTGLTD